MLKFISVILLFIHSIHSLAQDSLQISPEEKNKIILERHMQFSFNGKISSVNNLPIYFKGDQFAMSEYRKYEGFKSASRPFAYLTLICAGAALSTLLAQNQGKAPLYLSLSCVTFLFTGTYIHSRGTRHLNHAVCSYNSSH
jgi:hypothetical protein